MGQINRNYIKKTILLFLILKVCLCYSQDNSLQTDSVEQWKTRVLTYVHGSLDSVYELTSDKAKIEVLENLEEFIVRNDNGKHYHIGPNSIFTENWFYDLGYLKLYPEVIRLDSVSKKFNGFKFFYHIMTAYNSAIEPVEVMHEYMGRLVHSNPRKFIRFIEFYDDPTDIRKIAEMPWLENEWIPKFKKDVRKSKYADIILDALH
jgi:hypothetical protein